MRDHALCEQPLRSYADRAAVLGLDNCAHALRGAWAVLCCATSQPARKVRRPREDLARYRCGFWAVPGSHAARTCCPRARVHDTQPVWKFTAAPALAVSPDRTRFSGPEPKSCCLKLHRAAPVGMAAGNLLRSAVWPPWRRKRRRDGV
jgi:hypothetical protein